MVPPDSIFVSFDVSNLFPSIPTSECLTLVNSLLFRSALPDYVVDDLFSLLRVTLEQNFFMFDQKIFEQPSGLAMGSPLSPFLAEVFMNNLEVNHISKLNLFSDHVVHWYRFVDDVFAVFRGNESDVISFIDDVNKLHPNIDFTYELEQNNSLPFLDIKVSRDRDRHRLSFNIYRKDTTTDHVIPYDSYHPLSHKLSAFHSYFVRLFSIPLSDIDFKIEYNTIIKIAENNNFPLKIIKKLFNKKKKQYFIGRITTLNKVSSEPVHFFSLPFVSPVCYTIQNCLKSKNIKISFKPMHTLRTLLPSTKTGTDVAEKCGVYKIKCNSCGKFYIGKTQRSFKVRLKEHLSMLSQKHLANPSHIKNKSNFAYHVLSNDHDRDRNSHKQEFLHINNKRYTTDFLEQLEILNEKYRNPHNIVNEVLNFNNVQLLDKLVINNVF